MHRMHNGENTITYLFIGGLFGGLLRKNYVFDYFKDLENFLGQKHSNVKTEFIQNPYQKSSTEGASLIASRVRRLLLASHNDIVLIGHSRGSLELLKFIHDYPEYSHNSRIKKFVFGSPLFGKSHLGEIKLRYLSLILPKKLKLSLAEASSEDLEYEVQVTWRAIQDRNPEIAEKSIILKTASESPQHYPRFLRLSSMIIKKLAGENDGVLALSSQNSLPKVKEVRFYSNHGAIFCNDKINRSKQVNIEDVFEFIKVEPTTIQKPENVFILSQYRKEQSGEELR